MFRRVVLVISCTSCLIALVAAEQSKGGPVDDLEVSDSNRHSERSNAADDLDVSAQAPAPTLVRIRPNVGPLTQFVAPAIYHPGPAHLQSLIPYPLASGTKGVSSPAKKGRSGPPPAPVQQSQQPVQIYDSAPGEPEPYSFGFDVRDEYGNSQYRKEEGDNTGAVSGSYGYTDAAGVYRQVEYVADGDGFRAKVKTNEPGVGSASPADVELQAIDPPAGLYGSGGSSAKLRKRSGTATEAAEEFGSAAAASDEHPSNVVVVHKVVKPAAAQREATHFRPRPRSSERQQQQQQKNSAESKQERQRGAPATDSPNFESLRARA